MEDDRVRARCSFQSIEKVLNVAPCTRHALFVAIVVVARRLACIHFKYGSHVSENIEHNSIIFTVYKSFSVCVFVCVNSEYK